MFIFFSLLKNITFDVSRFKSIIMSETNQYYEELKLILKPYVQNHTAFDNLNAETHFISDLEINSANLVDVILDVEDKYNIEIDNESMEKMLTVQAAIDLIKEKLA